MDIGLTTARDAANAVVAVVAVAVTVVVIVTIVAGEATPATAEVDPHLATGKTDAEVDPDQVRAVLSSSAKAAASSAMRKATSSVTALKTVVAVAAPCNVEDASMIVVETVMAVTEVVIVGTRDTEDPLPTREAEAPSADTTTVEVDTWAADAKWDHLPADTTLGRHLLRRTGPAVTAGIEWAQ